MRFERMRSSAARTAVAVPVLAVVVLSMAAWAAPAEAAQAAGTNRGTAGGQQVWVARDAGKHNAFDHIGGMAASPDGSTVYVARSSNGSFVVVAHDAATGATLWSVRTDDPAGGGLYAHGAALSPDGSVLFVTGESEIDVDTRDTLTVAYSTAAGAVEWTAERALGQDTNSVPDGIAVSPNGSRVFVAGTQQDDPHPGGLPFVAAYVADTGGEAWTATYQDSDGFPAVVHGMDVSADGSQVFVTATVGADPPSNHDIVTIAYAAAGGSQQWATKYTGGIDDSAAGVAASPKGGRVFVTGYARNSTSDPYDFRVLAYRAIDGAPTQANAYDSGENDFPTDIAVSHDGSMLYVTGGASDFLTVAFRASTLKKVWAKGYDGGHGFDKAAATAVSPDDGAVYVTGESSRQVQSCGGDVQGTSYATLRYDAATGAQDWVSRYNGQRNDPDQPAQVATSPDGSLVYVTGDSDTGCVHSDVATVAYQA
jgi:DNA-binding beta-propeller fold protein YncE